MNLTIRNSTGKQVFSAILRCPKHTNPVIFNGRGDTQEHFLQQLRADRSYKSLAKGSCSIEQVHAQRSMQ